MFCIKIAILWGDYHRLILTVSFVHFGVKYHNNSDTANSQNFVFQEHCFKSFTNPFEFKMMETMKIQKGQITEENIAPDADHTCLLSTN